MDYHEYRNMRNLLRKIPKVLKEIEAIKQQRQAVLTEIKMVEEGINPQSQVLSGMPHGTGISMTTENEALKLISLKERYQDRLAELTERINALETFIYRIEVSMCWLSPDQTRILRMRYWCGSSMVAISIEMNISERQCFRLERQAFEIMGEHL